MVRRDFGTEKETLLVYLGGMKSMGITTSALNLLRNLDYDRYDVTAFYSYSRGRDRLKNIALVDPRVRVIPRAVQFNGSPRRVRQETNNLMVNGLPDTLSERHREFWTDEWQRMFGHARFDHLIDFSGYGCYAPVPVLGRRGRPQESIWLHNDMYVRHAARDRSARSTSRTGSQAVFTTYQSLRPPGLGLPRAGPGQPRAA